MKKIAVFMMFVALLAFSACGSSSSSDTPTVSDLSQLPKATNPMASATASISKAVAKANGAQNGLDITTTTSSSFNYLSSMGACNTFNALKEGIASASQADMILCFISQMNDSFATVTNPDGIEEVVDIYDGQYHIFNMNMVGDTGAPDRVKMRIIKTGGSITDFKMWMCKKDGDTHYQNEYTGQALSGSSLSMTALGRYSGGGSTGWHHVVVSGTLDASRNYTTKTITTKNWNTQATDPTMWSELILTQTPGAFSLSGYNKGSYSEGGSTGTYQDTSVGLGEMLGDTGALAVLAMGDGAVKYRQDGRSGENTYGQGGTNAWNGDTTAPEAETANDYYATAYASTYSTPAVQTTITNGWIAFGTDETWDCTDDVGVGIYTMPQTQYSEVSTACSAYTFDHNWINCYDRIGQCNGDNACSSYTGSDLTNCRACFTDGVARQAGTTTQDCLNAAFPSQGSWVSQMCPAM